MILSNLKNVLFLGDPAPGVVWYRGNQIYDKTFIGNELGVVQNTLSIQRYILLLRKQKLLVIPYFQNISKL